MHKQARVVHYHQNVAKKVRKAASKNISITMELLLASRLMKRSQFVSLWFIDPLLRLLRVIGGIQDVSSAIV